MPTLSFILFFFPTSNDGGTTKQTEAYFSTTDFLGGLWFRLIVEDVGGRLRIPEVDSRYVCGASVQVATGTPRRRRIPREKLGFPSGFQTQLDLWGPTP